MMSNQSSVLCLAPTGDITQETTMRIVFGILGVLGMITTIAGINSKLSTVANIGKWLTLQRKGKLKGVLCILFPLM